MSNNTLKITENIYLIRDIYWEYITINSFLVIDKKDAALIDAGIKKTGEKILKYIVSNNINLKYIVITHAHGDHYGSASMIKKKTNAKVACHLMDVPYLEDKELQFKENYCKYTPPNEEKIKEFNDLIDEDVKCDIILRDNDVLNIGDLTLKVVYSPGHTLGSICVYIPEVKALFTGDNLQWTPDFLEKKHFGLITDAVLYYKTLEKLQSLNIDYLLPGHYSILNNKKEIEKAFTSCIETYKRFENEILTILKNKTLSTIEIKNAVKEVMGT
ncbi:MAG: MBL fold metallo-hydrolase, partial [Candidatus Micrarchaeia archaeon]